MMSLTGRKSHLSAPGDSTPTLSTRCQLPKACIV